MHLKIFSVLVTLGLSSVSAKAKAKGDPQGYINVPVPVYPVTGFGLPQNYYGGYSAPQSAIPYQVGFAFGNNFGYSANGINGPVFVNPAFGNPQQYQANYYQQHIPVPVAYSGVASKSNAQSANQYRIWPKNLVNPNGTPSPPISGPDPLSQLLNYVPVSSTARPQTYQSTSNYDSQSVRNSQHVVSTPAPNSAQYSTLIPVPVNFEARNSLQQELVRYINSLISQFNTPVVASTPAPYLVNHQQPASLLHVVSSPSPYIAHHPQPTAPPSLVQYQSTASPFAFQHVTVTPTPYFMNYHQPTQSPFIYNNNFVQQSTASPFINQNQRTTESPPAYQNQQPLRSNFVDHYQRPTTTPSPYQNLVNNQRQSAASYSAQQSTLAPFIRNQPVTQQQRPVTTPSPFRNLVNEQRPSAVSYNFNQPPTEPVPFILNGQATSLPAESPFSNAGYYSQFAASINQQASQSSGAEQYEQLLSASDVQTEETTPTVLIGQHKQNKSPEQNLIEPDSTKPTSTTQSSTIVPSKKHSVTIVSTTPLPQTPEVTAESFLKSTTPTPETLRPEIIKTEYSGLVSPQYNHITSSPASIRSTYGPLVGQPAYVPLKNLYGYSKPTDIAHVKYNDQGSKYSYSR